MKRFKPYACFAFKSGGIDEDDPIYYQIDHYGEVSGVDKYGEWISQDSIRIYDDYILETSSLPHKNGIITEDGDELVPQYRISLEEYDNWRELIHDYRQRIFKLINNNLKPANNDPCVGEYRCWVHRAEGKGYRFDEYYLYKIYSIRDSFFYTENNLEIDAIDICMSKNNSCGLNIETIVRESHLIDETIHSEVVRLFDELCLRLFTEIQQTMDNREVEYPYVGL